MKTILATWEGNLPSQGGSVEFDVPDNAQLDIIIYQAQSELKKLHWLEKEPPVNQIEWTIKEA